MSRSLSLIIAILLLVIIGSVALLARQRQTNTTDTTTDIEQTIDEDIITPDATELSNTVSPAASVTTTASQSAVDAGTTVSYDGTNFSPRSVTVTPGTTVTFVNNSNRSMWVASDPHPTHTNFAAFDAKRNYAAGESYSFTFSQAGTYTFHDHLNASVRGTVTVQ